MSKILSSFIKNERAIKNFLRRFLRNSHDVEDVAQETFLKAYAAEMRQNIEHPRAFLFRVARNTAFKKLAKKVDKITDYIESYDVLDVESSDRDPEETVSYQQQLEIFTEAIATLPTQTRHSFILCKVKGMTQKEISEHMGIAVSTVEKHIANGLLRCGDYMDKRGCDVASLASISRKKQRKVPSKVNDTYKQGDKS